MIKSMTGFGRHSAVIDGRNIVFEIKSVNNRFADINIRMPRIYGALEERVKALVGKHLSRGKVDIFITVDNLAGDPVELSLNKEYLEGYLAVLNKIRSEYDVKGDITIGTVASKNEVFIATKPEEDIESIWAGMEQVAIAALEDFDGMRKTEGEKLRADLLARTETLRKIREKLVALAPETVKAAQERAKARIKELLDGAQVDESRLLTECAIFADKTDITEELVRLESHFSQFENILSSNEPVGRKCDFLVQEINREMNTTGSKCVGTEMTDLVIEGKAEIEKIREQIQNIE